MRTAAIALVVLSLASVSKTAEPASLRFREIGREAGITTAPHFSNDKRYLVETMGGGVAVFDCDNDGKLDIAVVNDSTIERYLEGGESMVTLYRQDKDLHFTDITQSAGLRTRGWGMGLAVGDFDGDGLPDLYVTGFGHNALYRNLGGCRFEDVTARAGVSGGGFSVGAAWADYDHDGHLDLAVTRYVQSDIRNLPQPGMENFNYKGLPLEVPAAPDTPLLFHNRGDGTFEEVSAKALANPEKRHGMGLAWADYDNDGWPDLFIANDMGPNSLFHNKRNGTFEEVGMISGTAVNSSGREMGNMTGAFGDYDRDGKLDLIVSRFGNQPLSVYQNQGEKGFWDVTWEVNVGRPSYAPVKWGTGFADFDNDGWLDIFLANGNVAPITDKLPAEVRYREPIQLFRNREGRSFEEVATSSGLNDGPLQSRRGTAFGDINNDGAIDVVVYNVGAPPSIFLNQTRNGNHRVLFRMIGAAPNRSAVGARVTIHTTKTAQSSEVAGGGSYLSSNDQRLHFGLGSEAVIKRVEIHWPSGKKQELQNVAADAIYTIVEGKGITGTVKLPPVQ